MNDAKAIHCGSIPLIGSGESLESVGFDRQN
jgi:hypothetical protein